MWSGFRQLDACPKYHPHISRILLVQSIGFFVVGKSIKSVSKYTLARQVRSVPCQLFSPPPPPPRLADRFIPHLFPSEPCCTKTCQIHPLLRVRLPGALHAASRNSLTHETVSSAPSWGQDYKEKRKLDSKHISNSPC